MALQQCNYAAKQHEVGARETTEQLRVCAAPPVNPSLVPSTHTEGESQLPIIPAPGNLMPLSLEGSWTQVQHTQAHTHHTASMFR